MGKVLLTRVGCRYTCPFCTSPRPYAGHFSEYDTGRNLGTLKAEVDATPDDCPVYLVSGCDPSEDLDLMFDLISYIREKKGPTVPVGIQSHCAALQDRNVVSRLVSLGVGGVYVPIYGATVGVHNTVMVPKPGVVETGFPQLEAVENCLAAGIDVFVRSVIVETNRDDMVPVIDTLVALAVRHGRAISFALAPVYYLTGRDESYIPTKDLPVTVRKVHRHLRKLDGAGGYLYHEIDGFPFCLFEEVDPSLKNGDFLEYLLGEYVGAMGNQLPSASKVYSAIDPRIPSYRIRVQAPICQECRFRKECAGFQQLDYERFGIGSLAPYRAAG